MYQVTQNATNKYTQKIYKLISSWRQKGAFTISLDEFRQWLCIENKYKHYSDIKERILLPVQNDLDGKSDVWFNCKAKDFVVKKGNTVTHLNFKVITPDLQLKEEKNRDQVFYLLKTHFKFEDRHIDQIRPIFDNAAPSSVIYKIQELHEYYIANVAKIGDITGYAIKSLLNEFCSPKLF